jgi:hypothetical protein
VFLSKEEAYLWSLLDGQSWDLRAVCTDSIAVGPWIESAGSAHSIAWFRIVIWVEGVDALSEEGDYKKPWRQMHITAVG